MILNERTAFFQKANHQSRPTRCAIINYQITYIIPISYMHACSLHSNYQIIYSSYSYAGLFVA